MSCCRICSPYCTGPQAVLLTCTSKLCSMLEAQCIPASRRPSAVLDSGPMATVALGVRICLKAFTNTPFIQLHAVLLRLCVMQSWPANSGDCWRSLHLPSALPQA